jgi:hypothetical protein
VPSQVVKILAVAQRLPIRDLEIVAVLTAAFAGIMMQQ